MRLAKIYRRALLYASTPMFVESSARTNRKRDQPLPRTANWTLAPRFIWNARNVETARA